LELILVFALKLLVAQDSDKCRLNGLVGVFHEFRPERERARKAACEPGERGNAFDSLDGIPFFIFDIKDDGVDRRFREDGGFDLGAAAQDELAQFALRFG
jgi:hypothetical protein